RPAPKAELIITLGGAGHAFGANGVRQNLWLRTTKPSRVVAPPTGPVSKRSSRRTRRAPNTKSSPIRHGRTGRHGWIGSRTILESFGLLNSTGRKGFGRSSGLGVTNGPELHVPLIMGCKFYPASSPMPLTRWVRLQATLATASSDFTKPI